MIIAEVYPVATPIAGFFKKNRRANGTERRVYRKKNRHFYADPMFYYFSLIFAALPERLRK